MKVLITGGAGFIGSHVVDKCVEGGHDVICLDSLDPGVHQSVPTYLRDEVEYCFADLRDWQPDARFLDVEAVLHFAALGGVSRAASEPRNIISANCIGTTNLAEYAKDLPKLKHFVLASSFSVYGSNYGFRCLECKKITMGVRGEENLRQGIFDVICPSCRCDTEIVPVSEDTQVAPLEGYAASKYMQELVLKSYRSIDARIFRFSSVYGPRLRLNDSEATIIAKLKGWIKSGKQPELFEDGNQIRDWVHIDDLVGAVLAVLGGSEVPKVMNICSGHKTTLKEACEIIGRVLDKKIPAKVVGGYRAGDVRHCLGDPRSLKTVLGRSPIPFSVGAHILAND